MRIPRGRLEAATLAALGVIGCILVSQPAFWVGYWISDSLRALVPLALVGYLAGPAPRRVIPVGVAIVAAAAALSVAWLVVVGPVMPGLMHLPFTGMPQVGQLRHGFPVLTRAQLLALGLRAAPGAAIRAAVLFLIGAALQVLVRAVSGRKAALVH